MSRTGAVIGVYDNQRPVGRPQVFQRDIVAYADWHHEIAQFISQHLDKFLVYLPVPMGVLAETDWKSMEIQDDDFPSD